MVQDASGGVVSDAGQLAIGAELRIIFAKGWARTEVKELGKAHATDLTSDGDL